MALSVASPSLLLYVPVVVLCHPPLFREYLLACVRWLRLIHPCVPLCFCCLLLAVQTALSVWFQLRNFWELLFL